jgi:hypothetical protein
MARQRKKVIAALKLLQSEGLGHLTIDEALAQSPRARAAGGMDRRATARPLGALPSPAGQGVGHHGSVPRA